ncbi:MAG: NAD-glutamate dehydrogenase domain-containing protein [Parachlamydiaceae bacterium]
MPQENPPPRERLTLTIENEGRKFQNYYHWLESSMPRAFFDEVNEDNIVLVTHNLMGFELQDNFSTIHLKNAAIILCLDSPDADLRVLQNYSFYGIKNYQVFVSKTPPPFPDIETNLRITVIYFTEAVERVGTPFALEAKEELRAHVKKRNPELTDEGFEKLLGGINIRFLGSLNIERLVMAIDMFFRAQTRDNCQYEVRYNENWEENNEASMLIVLAWRNTPKHNFLYRMARIIQRHHLMMKRVNASYVKTYSTESTLVMTLELHGSSGQAAWDIANIVDFLRELLTVKYFASFDIVDQQLVSKHIVAGSMGNFLRSAINFIHQALVQVDPNLYTMENIEESLCRHPELTATLCEAFRAKFDPDFHNFDTYLKIREQFLTDVGKLDTGQENNDNRRKTVLRQAMNMVHFTLKTNFFRTNLTAHSFRLDPRYLDEIPFEREKKFPELPYAIFFMKGMHFFGFHIRFKDLARGGLRTVYPANPEQVASERNNVFSECYNLAWTQHMKNKDIPEAGAKGIIFLNPFDRLESESLVLQKELEMAAILKDEIDKKVELFRSEQILEYLHQAQRSFIESLVVIVNCDPDGVIRAKNIIDYWHHPEYLYLGPDENMHDKMIQWIADFSKKYNYKPGKAFISSKPKVGINHKEYGVTSLGVNVYMEALLRYLGIDPSKTPFTVKMSGGPDGDVAGNQICNLYRYYSKTAKLLATIDVSGTIYDPQGLDLETLVELFKQGKPLKYYPPEKLSSGGFLLDKNAKRSPTAFVTQTLCWTKNNDKLEEKWLSGSDMNHMLRYTVHQTKADIFIPAGGRPRTLNEENIKEFLDETGRPTSHGIIEGANLYITPKARRMLEKLGVLIIKDSSANKTGVICSSFEVLCGLALTDELFIANKSVLVQEILERLSQCAANEAQLLLRTHKENKEFLTDISSQISERINEFTYQILDALDSFPWSPDPEDPLTRCFLNYCLPTLRNRFRSEILREIPDHHKKAVVACYLAAQLVYKKGLSWRPTIVDVLPVLLKQQGVSI